DRSSSSVVSPWCRGLARTVVAQVSVRTAGASEVLQVFEAQGRLRGDELLGVGSADEAAVEIAGQRLRGGGFVEDRRLLVERVVAHSLRGAESSLAAEGEG